MPYPIGILCLGLSLFLAGCSSLPAEWWTRDDAPPDEPAAVEPVAEQEVAPPAATHNVDEDVRELLEDAEEALAADRLTTPVHDNAFDRFQAVLLLRPGNQQAESGVQLVFSRYVSMIRSSLARGEPGRARALIERARLVDRDNPLLEDLTAETARARNRLAGGGGNDAATKEILLESEQLDRRDEALVKTLRNLAAQIRETEESLLIVARSDQEGRWIYQQMNESVPEYRLRGDIRLGREPRVLVLPPIE